MYLGPQVIEALVDILITSFDLVAIVDDTVAIGREGSDEQGNTGTDVRRSHTDAA